MLNLRRCVVGVVTVLLMSGMASAQTAADIAEMRFITELHEIGEAGELNIQYDLGRRYAQGDGVRQDYAKSVSWYRKAAEQGGAIAQDYLGNAYRFGQGVPQDYVEAHKWFNLAAFRAYPENRKRVTESRDEVASLMTRQQIADAQKLAREWQAAFEQRN